MEPCRDWEHSLGQHSPAGTHNHPHPDTLPLTAPSPLSPPPSARCTGTPTELPHARSSTPARRLHHHSGTGPPAERGPPCRPSRRRPRPPRATFAQGSHHGRGSCGFLLLSQTPAVRPKIKKAPTLLSPKARGPAPSRSRTRTRPQGTVLLTAISSTRPALFYGLGDTPGGLWVTPGLQCAVPQPREEEAESALAGEQGQRRGAPSTPGWAAEGEAPGPRACGTGGPAAGPELPPDHRGGRGGERPKEQQA